MKQNELPNAQNGGSSSRNCDIFRFFLSLVMLRGIMVSHFEGEFGCLLSRQGHFLESHCLPEVAWQRLKTNYSST